MKHDITVAGHGFKLRPVTVEDSDFIAALRSDPLLSRFLHPVSGRIEDQITWFRAYAVREGDYYFIVERSDGASQGTIGIYDVDPEKGEAEWGRWLLTPRSSGAMESARLIYKTAFEVLGLQSLYCRTIQANTQVVSLHDSMGLRRSGIVSDYLTRDGQGYDAVEHVMEAGHWPEINARIEPLAVRLASRMRPVGEVRSAS